MGLGDSFAGSVLKPFVYGMALDDGLIHPASLLQDVPRRLVITGPEILIAVSRWAEVSASRSAACFAESPAVPGAFSLWAEALRRQLYAMPVCR